MLVGILKDEAEVGKVAAEHVAKLMENADTLGVATGSSPLPLYEELRRMYEAGTFTLEGKKAFALDEYIGIAPDHPERYRNVLRTELVDRTGLTEENLNTPDGGAEDLTEAAAAYDASIKEAGGVHLQILGIGADGHIGFNEPGISLVSRTHVDALTSQTRKDNARFFEGDLDKVPTKCITQGLGTIMEARNIVLLATGANKADAVAAMIEGGISSLCPASILQMHPNVVVLLDEAAAAKLTQAEMYRTRWEVLR